MMISPEYYYEKYLKGKTIPELMTAIRSLKQEIGHLKSVMEEWDYCIKPHVDPDESTRLWCTRLYLERAKQALIEAGGTYIPSKAEQKVKNFEDNIPYISKLVLRKGAYVGEATWTFSLDDTHLYMEIDNRFAPDIPKAPAVPDYPLSKDELLDGIRESHIGEWRPSYDNLDFLDGDYWQLEFQYCNRHKPVRKRGDNAFPYNFTDFIELLGIFEEHAATEEEEAGG